MNTTLNTSAIWTATMKGASTQMVCDLLEVLTNEAFSIEDLERTLDVATNHPEQLVRSVFQDPAIPQSGCPLFHLSGGKIRSRLDAVKWFTETDDVVGRWQRPTYLAPGNIIGAWDGDRHNGRYGDPDEKPVKLSIELLIDTLIHVINLRKASTGPKEVNPMHLNSIPG